jgi:hypothetical protein
MKELFLKTQVKKDWLGIDATDDHYSILLRESTKVFKPDGSVLCVVVKNAFEKQFIEKTIFAFDAINRSIPVSPIGTLEWTREYPLSSVGFIEEYRFNDKVLPKRASQWNEKEPEKWKMAQGLALVVWEKYKEFEPNRSAFQLGVAESADQNFVIKGTGFTTITIGKNFPREYHTDLGCLVGGSTVFPVIQKGNWRGANLVFPDFEIAIELSGGDLMIFDSTEFHGNTPIKLLDKNAERWVNSYYFRELFKCK